jgi:hypothetical protein
LGKFAKPYAKPLEFVFSSFAKKNKDSKWFWQTLGDAPFVANLVMNVSTIRIPHFQYTVVSRQAWTCNNRHRSTRVYKL